MWTVQCGTALPRTCCSRLVITFTACCRIVNLVCGFSLPRCREHMRQSSWNAWLISCTLTLPTVQLTHREILHQTQLTAKKDDPHPTTPAILPVEGTDRGLPASRAVPVPRTCCSRVVIRVTACCSTPSFVCGFSWLMCSATILSSSLNASFISRTRTLLMSARPTKQSIRYNWH